MTNPHEIDLLFSYDGDIVYISGDGDPQMQFGESRPYLIFKSKIFKRLSSSSNDWGDDVTNSITCDLDRFIGLPANEETIEDIKLEIISTLAQEELVEPENISIAYIGVDRSRILLTMTVKYDNGGDETDIHVALNYDLRFNKIFVKFLDFKEF